MEVWASAVESGGFKAEGLSGADLDLVSWISGLGDSWDPCSLLSPCLPACSCTFSFEGGFFVSSRKGPCRLSAVYRPAKQRVRESISIGAVRDMPRDFNFAPRGSVA